jgi:hypothetical protein
MSARGDDSRDDNGDDNRDDEGPARKRRSIVKLPREMWSAHDLGRPAPLRTKPPPRGREAARPPAAASEVAAEPTLPLALAELWDLRRLGLFDDDGRSPPSWFDR